MISELQAVNEMLMEELEQECLNSVLSIREVCHMYNKTDKTIVELIKEGKLVGRQARFGSTWFVLKSSCDRRWPDYGRS